MGHTLWLHFGAEEHPCTSFDVHQGFLGFDTSSTLPNFSTNPQSEGDKDFVEDGLNSGTTSRQQLTAASAAVTRLRCRSLGDLIDEHLGEMGAHIDYLSLDTDTWKSLPWYHGWGGVPVFFSIKRYIFCTHMQRRSISISIGFSLETTNQGKPLKSDAVAKKPSQRIE